MSPIAFSIFGIDVRWYGILIALGAFLAIYLGDRLAKKNPALPKDVVTDYSIYGLIFGVMGARLHYVIFQWDYYSQHTNEILAIRNGGLAIQGGLIVGAIVAIVYCKIKKISIWELLDVIAPVVALAQAIGRWGNFANGEAHGGPTNLPWAIEVQGQMVHPTFLYESLLNVGIFLFLYFFLSKRRKFPGQLSMLYLMIYSVGRFFIEGLRTDSLYIGPLRTAQVISIICIVIAIFFYGYQRRKSHPTKYEMK